MNITPTLLKLTEKCLTLLYINGIFILNWLMTMFQVAAFHWDTV